VLVVKVVVRQWETVLLYKDGVFERALGPGRHRVRRRRREQLRYDLRPQLVAVPNQEILTADGLAPRITLVGRFAVSDARVLHVSAVDADAQLYTAIQVGLRSRVASRTLEELLAARDEVGAEVREDVAGAAAGVGRTVLDLQVRDLAVPAELRVAAVRVLTARQEGLAALERARGETAALRSLANAARLAQDVPALLALRTLRAVETGGATVVLRHD
jgi:regulator of protease activity HflC (stomatin/prohibitin superfamily)